MQKALFSFLCLFLTFTTQAQLDATFGKDGIVINNYGVGNVAITDAAIDREGRIVTIGYNRWEHPYYADVLLRRFLPDGSIDSSFGDKGHILFDIGDNGRNRGFIRIDSEGRYVFGASVGNAVAIGRMLTDGKMDQTFGEEGFFRFKMPSGEFYTGADLLQDLFIHPDNSITAAVETGAWGGTFPITYVAQGYFKLLPDGSPDVSYGSEGFVISVVKDNAFGFYSSADGQMRFDKAGNSYRVFESETSAFYSSLLLEKRLPDGRIDDSFGENGVVSLAGLITTPVEGFVIDRQGGFVLAASDEEEQKILFRLMADGQPDVSWGRGDGYLGLGRSLQQIHGLLQTDEHLIVYGAAVPGNFFSGYEDSLVMAAVFLDASGQFQSSVGSNGRINITWDAYEERCLHMMALEDGRFLMSGFISYTFMGLRDQAMAMIQADGTLDENFGDKGQKVYQGIENETFVSSCIPLSDGSVIIVGNAHNAADRNFFIAKHLPDGKLDPSFGREGALYTPDRRMRSEAVVIGEHRDLSALFAFRYPDSTQSVGIRRLLENGDIDQQWANGTGAIVLPDSEIGYYYHLMPDLKLRTFSVDENTPSAKRFIFRQFTPDGLPDLSFGNGGQETFILPGSGRLRPFGVYYLGNRTMFVGNIPDREQPVILLFNGNQIDQNFGTNGYVALNNTPSGYLDAIPDHLGNIYLLGRDWGVTWSKVGKLLPNGQPDLSFGVNGEYISSNFGDFNRPFLSTVIPDMDGSLYLLGSIRNVDSPVNQESLSVVKLSGVGVPDEDFGLNEVPVSPFYLTRILPMISKTDKKLLIAANRSTLSRTRYFITKWDLTINRGILSSVNEQARAGLRVYPNPAHTYLNIRTAQALQPDARLQVWDITGRLALEKTIGPENQSLPLMQVDLALPSSLPSGTYILTLQNGAQREAVRFFKK